MLPFTVMVVLIIVTVVITAASPSCGEPRSSPMQAEEETAVTPAEAPSP